jgi:uncharacterized protein YfaS (alpha-2-macroglobulin family)
MVAGSTLCLYGFRHGQHYQLTLMRGFAAADGRALSEDVSIEIAVDDRPSDLAFKADTLILPANGSGNVPLKAVNVPKQRATLMLAHVTDRQLINEVALGHVKSSLNIEDLTAIVQRAGRLVWWGSVDLLGERNKEIITAPGRGYSARSGFMASGYHWEVRRGLCRRRRPERFRPGRLRAGGVSRKVHRRPVIDGRLRNRVGPLSGTRPQRP